MFSMCNTCIVILQEMKWVVGFRVVVAASPRSRAQVAAVLAFVISHTTFLAAQDDETGRCPKVS